MTKEEALQILEVFNKWRRGGKDNEDDVIDMPQPKLIGEAIDVAIEVLKSITKKTL